MREDVYVDLFGRDWQDACNTQASIATEVDDILAAQDAIYSVACAAEISKEELESWNLL